jgi:thioredoxin reductase (NADPH)
MRAEESKNLTLVSRVYCHLCHDMEVALTPLALEFGVLVDVLDADADPELETLFGERVPVLLHDGNELCHYFLDTAKVRDYLSKIR